MTDEELRNDLEIYNSVYKKLEVLDLESEKLQVELTASYGYKIQVRSMRNDLYGDIEAFSSHI